MLSGHPQSTQNAALGLTSWQDKSWRMWAICPAHASMRSMASASPGSCVSALGGAFEEAAERGHSIKRTCAAFCSPVWLWRTDPARHRILGGPDTPSQAWSSTCKTLSTAFTSPGSCVRGLGGAFDEAVERGRSIRRVCAAVPSRVQTLQQANEPEDQHSEIGHFP